MSPSPATPRRLVLASTSPRRRELIQALDIAVTLAGSDREEDAPRAGETPQHYVSRLSLQKALDVASDHEGALLLGADTAVVIDGHILGKPPDNDEAIRMLAMLRGRVHTVMTGVALLDSRSGRHLQLTRGTDVRIREYSDAEVAAYMASGDHWDKAGAYAVQDQGFAPAKEVLGCYLNAMGFPLCEVAGLLGEMGMVARLKPGWRLPDQCQDCSLREPQKALRR